MSQTSQHTKNPYDRFAPIYNSHWGRNSLHFLPAYQNEALAKLPENARILDLCCGTGQFSQALIQRGYQVVGVDSSEEMLDFAAGNAPAATFLPGDVRRFRPEHRFDAAVCVYDSLNHLLLIDDLLAAFETACRCLKPNGVFAFDLNMEAKYRDSWRGEFTVSGRDDVYEMVSRVDHPQRLATLAAARKSNSIDDEHEDRILFRQTWYSEALTIKGLKLTGFGEIRTVPLSAPTLSDPERMLFVCRKV